MQKLIVFDLDNTLTESKAPLTRSMAHLLERLLVRAKVAIISGGAFPQFISQVVARLSPDAPLANLYLLPTSGASLYEWKHSAWQKVYEERISETDAAKIETAMKEGAKTSGVIDFDEPAWGARIEYRGGQVSYSALGQEAPVAEKKAWDPDHRKRRALRAAIAAGLPHGYVAAMGGSTTIDVTKRGVNKAYGIHQLSERLHIPEKEMLYVGDELVAGGNDEIVFTTEIETKAVTSPTGAARFIGQILA